MKSALLLLRRVVIDTDAFAEILVGHVPHSVPPSDHRFKYRFAYIVAGQCVLRYDNERGKGDHRHVGTVEEAYAFTTPEQLMADFTTDIERWNHENGRS